jgi:hypothetical protein
MTIGVGVPRRGTLVGVAEGSGKAVIVGEAVFVGVAGGRAVAVAGWGAWSSGSLGTCDLEPQAAARINKTVQRRIDFQAERADRYITLTRTKNDQRRLL